MGAIANTNMLVFEAEPFFGGHATGEIIPLAEVRWLTPCTPGKVIGLWNNFRAAAVQNGWSTPAEPLYFLKSPNSYNAHREPIVRPRSYDGRIVFEGELGVVIGKQCHAVSVDEAPQHIFGYTCVNDVTAIDLLSRDASFPQWTRAKGFDGFGVFGPVIATDVDSATLHVRTLVSGRERQNYPVSDMIFTPAALVSLISHDMTLLPGDIISCGTSLGVSPMRHGAVVEIAIEGIGTLTNKFVSEASAA